MAQIKFGCDGIEKQFANIGEVQDSWLAVLGAPERDQCVFTMNGVEVSSSRAISESETVTITQRAHTKGG